MKIIGEGSKKKHEVAVFMTCFNNADYLDQAINSIILQDFPGDFHLFIHDDASTDGSVSILESYQAKYPNKITLVLQEKNQFSLGLPIGIDLFKNSSSEYIAFCDADDFWNSNKKLRIQVRFLRPHKWCALVHSLVNVQNDSNSNQYAQTLVSYLDEFAIRNKRVSGRVLGKYNYIITSSVLLRRSELPEALFAEIGNLQPLDHILFALATRYKDIGFVNKEFTTYRVHDNNYWGNSSRTTIKSDPIATQKFIDKYAFFNHQTT
jgi:glycosyltransferase involved in cell wall biosynthesis